MHTLDACPGGGCQVGHVNDVGEPVDKESAAILRLTKTRSGWWVCEHDRYWTACHEPGCVYSEPASETPGQGEGDLRGEVSLRIERHFGHDEGAECGPRCGTSYDGPMPPLDPPHHCAAVEQRTLAEQKVARVKALCQTGVFDVSAWGERGTPFSNGAARAFGRIVAALADPEADQ